MFVNILSAIAVILFFVGCFCVVRWICKGISVLCAKTRDCIVDYIERYSDDNYMKFRIEVDRARHSEEHLKGKVNELYEEISRLKDINESLKAENATLKIGRRRK